MIEGRYLHQLLVDIKKLQNESPNKLGEGAYGVVTKGTFPKDSKYPNKHCAIKTLNDLNFADFRKEVGCQAQLDHIAVLPLLGCSLPLDKEGKYVIVTEFMENGSLHELIQKVAKDNTPDDWETIKAINIFGIAAGMAYIHQKNVIHRDLKTSNIMLDENYNPKIADFGFSKEYKDGNYNRANMTLNIGTQICMAPEQFDDPNYTNKVDVYAYSMILYEILSLKVPWSDRIKLNILTELYGGKRPKIESVNIPESFKELIERCWDTNPDVRPKFIKIVEELENNKEKYFDFKKVNREKFLRYVNKAKEGLEFDDQEAGNSNDNDDDDDGY